MFKPDVQRLLTLLGQVCQYAQPDETYQMSFRLQEREADRASRLEQAFAMQEEFDEIVQQIKASFREQIRK